LVDVEHLSFGGGVLPKGDRETGPVDDRLASVEGAHVQRILDQTGGNKRKTAQILDISRPRLDRLIQKHDLEVPG
jgi:DNA-binding NtrC family response regulator